MADQLNLGFSETTFAEAIAHEVATPGVTPRAAARRFIVDSFATAVRNQLGPRLIKSPIIRLSLAGRGLTLADLAQYGCESWYPEIRFSTKAMDAYAELVVVPHGFDLIPIEYGGGVRRTQQLTLRHLKTQANHEVRLNHVALPGSLFKGVIAAIKAGEPLTQPWLANANAMYDGAGSHFSLKGFLLVCFEHIMDGKRVYCSCAKAAHDIMRQQAADKLPRYVPGSWPHQVQTILNKPVYQEGICHLCVARSAGAEAAALCYGDNLVDFEQSYMTQLIITNRLDERTARAEVQQQLGLSRWKSEAQM